jgi:hypothetical protein
LPREPAGLSGSDGRPTPLFYFVFYYIPSSKFLRHPSLLYVPYLYDLYHPGRMGMAINVSLLVATIFKILNACWVLAVNSDKKENMGMLKWQCLFSPIIAGLVIVFSGGLAKLSTDGGFFKNAIEDR